MIREIGFVLGVIDIILFVIWLILCRIDEKC